MKTPLRLLASAALAVVPFLLRAADEYPVSPDSVVHPGVPAGELIKFNFTGSKIFPGTVHEVTVYVPQQYDPARPACVHINQDGVQYNAPVVFDNLIAKGELPVLIGVFIKPGIVPAANPAGAWVGAAGIIGSTPSRGSHFGPIYCTDQYRSRSPQRGHFQGDDGVWYRCPR